jgi:pimeloyl-ACP methyl ester carboxylesterase
MSEREKLRDELTSVPEMPAGSTDIAPLATYNGTKPTYPEWVTAALAQHPARANVPVRGVSIEMLTWGDPSDEMVVLLHGNGAHADWWSFLAPILAASRKYVVAMSFSGMGGSGWRSSYVMSDFVAEILAVIAASKSTNDKPPVLIGHSFGGFPALVACLEFPKRFGGLIMLDSGIEPPGEEWTGPPHRTAPNRVYATLAEALARFRLAPPQDCDNHWALDHIARTSLKEVEGGWTWKFDPFLWNSFDFKPVSHLTPNLAVPAMMIRGQLSFLLGDRIFDYMRTIFPAQTGFATIPQANHHVMLDQPLATLAAIEAALAGLAILPKTTAQG